jgi:uncharacterized protein
MLRNASASDVSCRAPGPMVWAFAAMIVAALMLALAPYPAAAQDTPAHRSYINPFPNGDRYRVVVLGDSMAEGLWEGLYRAFEDDPTLDFTQQGKKWTGFVRPDKFDWNAEIGPILKDGNYNIAVVMFGVGEAQPIVKDGKTLKIGTEEWRRAYGERVETFIKKLRGANLATYWVGLPVMRSPGQTEDAEKLNDLFREKAFVNGAKFIDTWEGFVDDQGRFSAYGPDMQGQTKRLRADDGVHFTMRGYLKLAHFLDKELRKDLTLAKEERDIPLAGDEEEQSKVANRFAALTAKPEATKAEPDEATPEEEAAEGEQDRDALQESQVGDVSVVRPSFSEAAPTVDFVTETAGASTSEPEVITEELPGGYTAMATISAVTDLTLASSRPQLPLSQRPYYRVLIRGEQLDPKSGRADDFAWPPS